jgi:hypothetical protein
MDMILDFCYWCLSGILALGILVILFSMVILFILLLTNKF